MSSDTKLQKRGSLQRNARMSIAKRSTYSVPCFLDIPGRSGIANTGRVASGPIERSTVIYSNRRDGRKSVRAGTLESLVELLAEPSADGKESNDDYVETFIATHNYFIDSQSFMTRLMERFYDGEEVKVIDVFKKWVMTYGYEDFSEENLILFNMFLSDLDSRGNELFSSFTTQLRQMLSDQQALGEKMKKLEEEDRIREEREQQIYASFSPDLILYRISGLQENMFTPRQIAFQLTKVEYLMFKEIPQREYLHNAWSKKDGKEKARRLNKLIARFNNVSFWVATSILTCSHKTKNRTKMLALFIHVADVCLRLQNFQSAMQIYSALNLTPIQRLKDEWKALPKKESTMYTNLTAMFESEGNFRRYRTILKNIRAPAIPLLSLILSDLTVIEENENQIAIKEGEGGVSIELSASASSSSDVADSEGGSGSGTGGSGHGNTNGQQQEGAGVGLLIHFEKMTMIYETTSILKKCFAVAYPDEDDGRALLHPLELGTEGELKEKVKKLKKGDGNLEDLIHMVTCLPRLTEKELYDFKGPDVKKKVSDLKKAYKAALKERKK